MKQVYADDLMNQASQRTLFCRRLSSFHLTVDNWDAVCALKDTTPPSGKNWSVLLMVDTGSKRGTFQ